MIVELDDDDNRLLYAVVLEAAQEHSMYASTSPVGERLCKLAVKLRHRPDSSTQERIGTLDLAR